MAAALAAAVTTSKPSVPEHVLHKNRLQEYAQRSAIPLPIYQTINEGYSHAPRFRSTVVVDGASYVTSETYSQRKEAEQAVAKFALEHISEKIKNEGCPLIVEDTIFCKSILNEYAVKMNLEKPSYKTTQSEGLLPVFVSSLSFKGKIYTGSTGRNKKEAEQLAARTVIQSILGESNSGTCLSEIIKSKIKLYAAMHKIKDPGASTSERREVGVASGTDKLLMITYSGTCQGQQDIAPVIQSCVHELKKPKEEPFCFATTSFYGPSEPVPHVHQPHPYHVRNDVPLAQPPAVIVGGSQGRVVGQTEVPLAQPSAVTVRSTSEGRVVGQTEVPLAESSAAPAPAVNVGGGSQGGVVGQTEVPLAQPSAVTVRSTSQGRVVGQTEVPLAESSAVNVGGSSQGIVVVQNEVPLAQPSAVSVRGSSQGRVVVQNEVPLALPSAVVVRDGSQGIAVGQNEVPLALPSAVVVRDGSQGIAVGQNEVPLAQPSAIGGSSQGTVVATSGVKRARKKNKRGAPKRLRNEGSELAMSAVNQTTSCSVAQ